jgi:hypothetical protein
MEEAALKKRTRNRKSLAGEQKQDTGVQDTAHVEINLENTG